jgi:cobalamin biosynthesis Mg chelatase CobN
MRSSLGVFASRRGGALFLPDIPIPEKNAFLCPFADAWRKPPGDMMAGLVFYRAYWVNRNCEVEDALIRELESLGVGVVAVFTESVGRSR